MDFSEYSKETVKQQVSTFVLVEQQEESKSQTQSDQTFEDIQITKEKIPSSNDNDIPSETESEQEINQYQNSETLKLAKQADPQQFIEFQNLGQMQVKMQDDFLEEFGFDNKQMSNVRQSIQTQISSTISSLKSDEKQYNIFRSLLSETLKYFPKPPPVDYNSDQDIQNYSENIKHLKEVCSHFFNFHLKFNSLQNKSSLLFKEFSRLQSQVSQSIIQHFSVSYILTKEDLGQLFNQVQHNQEKLEKIVNEWQTLEQDTKKPNIQSIISNITLYYSQVFGLKQKKDQVTDLDKLNAEINSIQMEQSYKIEQMNRIFEQKMQTISANENEIKLSQTKLKYLQQQFSDEMKILLEKENPQKSKITRELFEQIYQKSIESYSYVLDDFHHKIDKENKTITNCQNEIDQEKVNLLILFSDEQKNEQFNSAMLNGLDFNKLYFNKNLSIKNEYKQQIDQIQEQVIRIKKENEENKSSLKQFIKDLGFQNDSHFLKFDSLCQNLSCVQIFFCNMIQKNIELSQQLMCIDNMLESKIDFSSNSIRYISQGDNQYKIFKFYLRFDSTINVLDAVDAKKKILLICQSSILEHCKEIGLEKFYNKIVAEIDFNILFEIVDKKEQEQDSFIKDKIIPDMLRPHRALNQLKAKYTKLTDIIKRTETRIKETLQDIRYEQDECYKQELREELKELKEELKDLQDDFKQIQSQLEEEQLEFYEQNWNEIKVITQISYALLKAILVASLKQKYQISIMPFFSYVEISNKCNSSINGYKPLEIKSS